MKLPVINEVQYLSPTAFQEYILCNHKFYLKRVGSEQKINSPQSKAMATGIAFDLMVKFDLHVAIHGTPCYDLLEVLTKEIDAAHRVECVEYAERFYDVYKKSGWYSKLLNSNVATVVSSRKSVSTDGIVLYGLPDAILDDGTIVDWKIKGSYSKNGLSPTPGFISKYKDGVVYGPHPRYKDPIETINLNWAIQLSFYGWIYNGIHPFVPIKCRIEEGSIYKDTITFATYKFNISTDFQEDLYTKVKKAWENINNNEYSRPVPSKSTCFAYNQPCDVMHLCEYYQKIQEDPILKIMLE